MTTKNFTAIWVIMALLIASCTPPAETENLIAKVSFTGIEFDMPDIPEPVIPDNEVNIKDFGAISGGEILNSKAFKDAIEAVSKMGGGKVVIPHGIWLTGPILLKSNLELHAEDGAIVIFSPNKDLYPLIKTSFEGLDTWRCISPIYGKDLENIAFTGKGVWDGSGDAWRYVKKSKLSDGQWNNFLKSGGVLNAKGDVWYPSEQFKKATEDADQNVRLDLTTKEEFQEIRDFLRPVLLSIVNSKNVLLEGGTFQNSPAWNLHPLGIENLIVRNVTVKNPWYSQNGDGLDVESCKNVLVENSNFDVGDDAICIKSGKDADGRNRGIACENIIVRNCIVYHGHGGVTIGSEMSGGVKNLHVSNVTFMGTDVGLRFKSTRGRGGVVEDIFISDVFMTNIPTNAISFNLYYGGRSVSEMMEAGGLGGFAQPEPVTVETPQFKNISIKNVEVKGALQAVFLQGLPEMNLENFELTDMILDADKGFSLIDVDGVKISNIKLITKSKTSIDIINGKNIEFKNIDAKINSPESIIVVGDRSENISFIASKKDGYKPFTTIGKDVKKDAIKF